ncbi:12275_t:CDS:2, partial [Racocetra persica]
MDKKLLMNNFSLICCAPAQFSQSLQDIKNEIESRGFSVIKAWNSDIITLKTISQALGIIQPHIRAAHDGIISELDSKDSSWKNFKDQYQGTSKEVAISPHTDGAFLEGMFPAQTTMVKICPPKMLLLQPIEYDANGGEIILVDGKKVLESILTERPKLAEILMKPGCIAFYRDDLMSMNYPVYMRMQDDSIRVHFRYDWATFAPYWSHDAVKFLHNNYHMNPAYQVKVLLKEKDHILILDNHRMLHGRSKFAGNRKLRRVWLNDDNPIIFKNVHDIYKNNRATIPYTPYIPFNDDNEVSPVAILYQALQPPIVNGIRKPLKPGGYSDSGADIAYSLISNNIPI